MEVKKVRYRNKNNNANEYSIVAVAQGDVTGDRVLDNVYLKGKKETNSPFIQDITLVVRDGRTKKTTEVPLNQNAGYNPTLFLGDFSKNGISDILIIIQSGGSGAFTYDYVYSFVNNMPRLMFDSNTYREETQYSIIYKDNYLVEVTSKQNNAKYFISLAYKDEEYLNEIYNSDGTLKEPIEGFVNPISSLFPVDVDSNNTYELLAFQKIAGRYNADALGYIQNFLRWDINRFTLFNQYIGIYGAEQ